MKISMTLAVTVLSLFVLQAHGQTEPPKGYEKGSVLLADGSAINGYIKDNISKNASVSFIAADEKKKNYDGAALKGVEISGTKYVCINNDFFKLLCDGELQFLQKSSDASGKLVYNGSEGSFSSGTEGKPGDYFIYNNKAGELKWVSKKNIKEVAESSFAGYTAAIDKAKAVTGDLAQLKEAVEIFNSRNK